MTDLLTRIGVAGGASGLASFLLPVPAAVAAGLLCANCVAELQRSKRSGEPFSWQRALTYGSIAAAVAYVMLTFLYAGR